MMNPNDFLGKYFPSLCLCFAIAFSAQLSAQTSSGQVMTDPKTGISYTYHLLGDIEAANPRKLIPASGNNCKGTPGWISYALTHQLNADPELLKICQKITGTKSFCGVMSRITMGCGYYLYCPGGNKDLKFSGNNIIYRIFVNTEKEEIYVGEFVDGVIEEVHKCYVGRKWFETDPEYYEKPVVSGNPVCSNPPPEEIPGGEIPEEVKITYPPVAKIEANPIEGDKPLTVAFDGTKSYDPDSAEIVKYQWDFGEIVLEDSMPTFEFDIAGPYKVILTVFDEEGKTDTASIIIQVNEAQQISCQTRPVARIIAENFAGFAPLFVHFDGNASFDPDGGDIVSYKWETDGKIVSLDSEIDAIAFSEPGEHVMTLIVTDDEGEKDTTTRRVKVLPAAKILPDTCWMMSYTIRSCGNGVDTVQQMPIRVPCPAPPYPQIVWADSDCDAAEEAEKETSRFQLAGGAIFNRHRGQLSEYSLGGNIQIRYRLGKRRRMAVFVDGSVLPVRRATPLDDRPYKWSELRDSIDQATGLPLVWYRGTSRGTASLGGGLELAPFPWLFFQAYGSVERTFQQEEISDPRKDPSNQFVGFDLEIFYASTRIGIRKDHLEIYVCFRALQENRPFSLILSNPIGGSHNAGWDKAYEVGLSLFY